jgi:hypothetical protein
VAPREDLEGIPKDSIDPVDEQSDGLHDRHDELTDISLDRYTVRYENLVYNFGLYMHTIHAHARAYR